MKSALRAALQLFVADYWNGRLYTIEPSLPLCPEGSLRCGPIQDTAEIAGSRYEEVRSQAWTREQDTWAFGAWVESELAAVCWFQARETYKRRGGLFELAPDEAELAQITTARVFRARGIAAKLIRYAADAMGANGFRKLYAKIWRGNLPSSRAFERAGWKFEKNFISLRLRGGRKPLMFTLPG